MDIPKIIASAEAENKGEIYKTILHSGSHQLIADEPPKYGGSEAGPSPVDYLCMALASCKAITIRMYAQRKQWKVEEVNVTVKYIKGDETTSGMNSFFCEVRLAGDLTDEQIKRIIAISKACPVDRLLSKSGEVTTVMNKKN